MEAKITRTLAVTVALGAVCWAADISMGMDRGGHFGSAGHFGSGHFGGAGHFGSVGHFGGAEHLHFSHFGAGRLGATYFGARHFGGASRFSGAQLTGTHVGAAISGGRPVGEHRFSGGSQLGGRNGLNRNAFGDRQGWDRWGGNGGFGEGSWGYHPWGYGGWGDWAGPVFWPFLLGDVFSSALWPYAYGYDPFWSYGAYFDDNNSGFAPAYRYSAGYAQTGNSNPTDQPPPDVTQSCGGFAPGVTDFPIDRIRQAIQPTGEQNTALDDLAAATSKASAIVNASCPSEAPRSVLGRFQAVEARLEATMKAIQIVRPPLAAFYDSLSDEQKQRLGAIGADQDRDTRATAPAGSSGSRTLASLCQRQAASFNRPLEHIEAIIQPTAHQQAAIDQLKQASAKAADEILESCPHQIAETPVARLDAMNARLESMVQAIQIVQPELATLYDSLSDEQKARFNLGPGPEQAGGRAKVGALSCNLAPTVGYIVGSRQRVSCRYTPDGPWPPETYYGHFSTVGLDIGVNGGGHMVWGVFAPVTGHYRGALAGTYVGASADVAVGVGLGANVLVGGSRRSIALQPLSVEGNTGIDLSAGISRLRLHWLR